MDNPRLSNYGKVTLSAGISASMGSITGATRGYHGTTGIAHNGTGTDCIVTGNVVVGNSTEQISVSATGHITTPNITT